MQEHPLQSRDSSFMNRFVKLKNARGFTLIELLATMALSTLVIGLIGSTIFFGLKTYNQAITENQLRDEANYYVTRILREIYEFSPDYIENMDDETGIIAHTFQDVSVTNKGLIRSTKGEKASKSLDIRLIKDQQSNTYQVEITGPYTDDDNKNSYIIDASSSVNISNSEDGQVPSIQANFFAQESNDTYQETGIISINLYLSKNSIGPVGMQSSFGF
ncbi:prepilin-type N-terminal cleavage/methylation domain-containing protein [Pontibacillus yanchengensis]|uniref:Prepilin-type N-terminal cleavage/methylation domain-containing protein n=1 Tax=Pontibacillus yanchengensis TaxID=462910 RepID=A0A6I4ZZL3_9BACI|nr:prepilin-type N-terminal cleavage/methylation domain-containing protein [Pontibacillus yanchengensis]MYL33302.1 prepilin-type N-terminal cleavage/methylation domain-containing protein [Pontibacillus yanchengensis]